MNLDRVLRELTDVEQRALYQALAERLGQQTLTEEAAHEKVLAEAQAAIVQIHLAEEARGKPVRPEEAREILKQKNFALYERMVEASRAWTGR